MKKFNLEILVPEEDLKDSMLLDSGTVAITYTDGKYKCEIRVAGNVRVHYKGEVYKHFESFPEALQRLFQKGCAYDNKDVTVDENNWFELFVYNVDGSWTGWSDPVDGLEDYSPTGLFGLFESYIEQMEKQRQ